MKKFLFSMALLFVMPIVFADETAFFEALKTCSPYSSSGAVSTEGMSVKASTKITGWENDKCVYKEFIDMQGINSCVTCKFSKTQLNELVSVMRAYSIVSGYTDDEVDTSNLDAVKSNPVVKVWNKYFQDSSVCNTEINQ